jgi:hypothetical protein
LLFVPVGLVLILLLGFLDYRSVLRHQLEHGNRVNSLKLQLDRVEAKVDVLVPSHSQHDDCEKK